MNRPGQTKWLSNDYVKFIRFGQWRIEQTGEGVLGFVTSNSYLDNPTFLGMRNSLMHTFDEIYILDMHGSVLKQERAPDGTRDEGVFDIQQGVAIGLFIKKRSMNKSLARVFHADLWGKREETGGGGKYNWLAENDMGTTEWEELTPQSPLYLFVPRDESLSGEYATGWAANEIFSRENGAAQGIVTTHDEFAISWTREEAIEKVERFLTTDSEAETQRIWNLRSTRDWQYENAKRALRDDAWRNQVVPILYRPFDNRVTVINRNVAVHRREKAIYHVLGKKNLGLCLGKASQVVGGDSWNLCLISRNFSDANLFRRGGNRFFSLYVYPRETPTNVGNLAQPNLNQEFVEEIASAVRLEFVTDGMGDLKNSFGPEAVLGYIYAILYSLEYRRRYLDFLKTDFPRIPVTSDQTLFVDLVRIGERLITMHLLEAEGVQKRSPGFAVAGSNRVEKVNYSPPANGNQGRVWINDTQHFNGVDVEIWNFIIGGYQPAKKWLSDRKDRVLAYTDIAHYCRMCSVLGETLATMIQIDETIIKHGGWPLKSE